MVFLAGFSLVLFVSWFQTISAQCNGGQSLTFSRWSGVAPEGAVPVFVYTASENEASLTGTCLAKCRELDDCAAVAITYGSGGCHGVAAAKNVVFKVNSDVSYFQKICMDLPDDCRSRWWAVEVTPGYNLHSESPRTTVVLNSTIKECSTNLLTSIGDGLHRSAQWVGREEVFDPEMIQMSEQVGNCLLNVEDKFTEPESYRVANYQSFYIENQCRHDYAKKIDRCSYEEYYNQTLKHIEYSITNTTKDRCKLLCEKEEHFVCRGFTWVENGRDDDGSKGVCDLHSEDLVSTGSWLLRKTSYGSFYRRVICLNVTVDCEGPNLIVTYRPRSVFRGRVYVPGRGEQCSAKAENNVVKLQLPLYGDCDVNFAFAITNGPSGTVNRSMAYALVMVQNNPIIQTAGDRWVRVGCSPHYNPSNGAMVDAVVAVKDHAKPSPSIDIPVNPSAASAVFNNAGAVSLYVIRSEPAPPSTSAAAVALGEPLELRVETTDFNEIEPYHLVASSRLGDNSVLLLDSQGCPTEQVDFPSFTRSWHNGMQRLSARFKAFRFPTSHVVRFALMVRYCDGKCPHVNCAAKAGRLTRGTNGTSSSNDEPMASVKQLMNGVVAQGGPGGCGSSNGNTPLELEMIVESRDVVTADNLVHADHRSIELDEEQSRQDSALVCVHELVIVALALGWLAVQVLLLLGCGLLVNKYRKLAEMSMQKDYQSFDNIGFDTGSTHRRVHWSDQYLDTARS